MAYPHMKASEIKIGAFYLAANPCLRYVREVTGIAEGSVMYNEYLYDTGEPDLVNRGCRKSRFAIWAGRELTDEEAAGMKSTEGHSSARQQTVALALITSSGRKLVASALAHAVRNAVEDFHAAGTEQTIKETDEYMPEFNRAVRNAIYTALCAFFHTGDDKAARLHASWIMRVPDYWEEPELLLPEPGSSECPCEDTDERECMHIPAGEDADVELCFEFGVTIHLSDQDDWEQDHTEMRSDITLVGYEGESDEGKAEKIGYVEVWHIEGSRAYDNGLDIVELCDVADQELYDYARSIYASGTIDDAICETPLSQDILVLHRMEIDKRFRGKGYGLAIAKGICERLGYHCGAILIKPAPLQFSEISKKPGWQEKYDTSEYPSDEKTATAKLQKYWAKLGLRKTNDPTIWCIPQDGSVGG